VTGAALMPNGLSAMVSRENELSDCLALPSSHLVEAAGLARAIRR
jgi:hypothetical protein